MSFSNFDVNGWVSKAMPSVTWAFTKDRRYVRVRPSFDSVGTPPLLAPWCSLGSTVQPDMLYLGMASCGLNAIAFEFSDSRQNIETKFGVYSNRANVQYLKVSKRWLSSGCAESEAFNRGFGGLIQGVVDDVDYEFIPLATLTLVLIVNDKEYERLRKICSVSGHVYIGRMNDLKNNATRSKFLSGIDESHHWSGSYTH